MIRRNFLKAIASVLGLGAAAPVIKTATTSKTIDVIPTKLFSEYYFYNQNRVVLNTHDEIKVGDNLFQDQDGGITNKLSENSGYNNFIGTAYSNSDQNGWCVVQLTSLI